MDYPQAADKLRGSGRSRVQVSRRRLPEIPAGVSYVQILTVTVRSQRFYYGVRSWREFGMHATVRAEIPWTPSTEEERAAVLREMERLLSSRHFCNSKRYPALLEYIVRETLAGNADSLKER